MASGDAAFGTAMRGRLVVAALACVLAVGAASCGSRDAVGIGARDAPSAPAGPERVSFEDHATPKARKLAAAAQTQVGRTITYDPAYVQLDYPGGDVPIDRGVCTDVVVRAFREVGVDLQVKVHEDMTAHFGAYPRRWGLKKADSNIDHRRVPNLQTYFTRQGKSLPVTDDPKDYWPGDIVSSSVGRLPHIGIVSTVPAPDGSRYCVVHNIGSGTRVEDALFAYPITGHYRPF